jgi:hypothetical protein
VEDVIEVAVDVNIVGHVVLHEPEPILSQLKEMLDVFRISGHEVVHADDLMALFDETIAEMRSEKAGSAGDECAWHRTRTRK